MPSWARTGGCGAPRTAAGPQARPMPSEVGEAASELGLTAAMTPAQRIRIRAKGPSTLARLASPFAGFHCQSG
jgi:hypothetical protein